MVVRIDPDHILLAFAYDGAPFHGVWPQPNVPTAGQVLMDRLEHALGRRPEALALTARTDAGVHAQINLATVRLWRGPADTSGLSAIETPRDDGLGAVRGLRVPSTVYARGLASRKRYRYLWRRQLDVDAMRRAATHLVGTLDVAALRGRRVDPERCRDLTISRVDVLPHEDGVEIIVEGNRFVRRQVRVMAAVLAQVGRGERPPDSLVPMLASRDPRQADWPAPAADLTLQALQIGQGSLARWWASVEQAELGRVAQRPVP